MAKIISITERRSRAFVVIVTVLSSFIVAGLVLLAFNAAAPAVRGTTRHIAASPPPDVIEAPNRQTSPVQALISTKEKSLYTNPADFALKATDFGGHPSYGKAMLYKTCMNYFASREHNDQDMADAGQLARSGGPEFVDAAQRVALLIQTQEIECQNVQPSDIASINSLMREAAAEGDAKAQSYLLRDEYASSEVDRIDRKLSGKTAEGLRADFPKMLASAVALAQRGDQDAALLAGQLQLTELHGQKNLEDSMAWTLVGLQSPGEAFDPKRLDMSMEHYSSIDANQQAVVVATARSRFNACCSSLQRKP